MNVTQDRQFQDAVLTFSADAAIEWLNRNVDPEDVFSEDHLSAWAARNGFIKEEN